MVTALKRDTGGPAEKHRQPCKEFYHENQPSQTLRRSAGRGADHVLRFIFEKRRPPNRRYRRREKRDEMQTILIIDDDAAIGNLEQEVLERAGYAVQRAYSGTEALLLLRSSRPDLILLDLMLPGLSGEEVLPKIQGIPVIVVSARAAVQDKVDLLLGGAADYLTKPFDTKELLARVAVRLRENARSPLAAVYTYGELTLDTASHEVRAAGRPVQLTRTEYAILKLLMQNPGQVLAKSVLLDRISADTPDCTESSLKTHVSNLRGKLRAVSGRDYVEAVWGIGFRLAAES